MDVWPQFKSPLVWDVFAVSTYALVSLLFWFVGLIPDLATLRDRAQSRTGRMIYGILAMGWRGSAHHWHRYETAYLLLAGLATPLVVSVHTVVSFDFAVGDHPRLAHHDLPALLRRRRDLLRLRDGADAGHPDPRRSTASKTSSPCATWRTWPRCMLVTGLIVGYGYVIEAFMAWYGQNQYETFMLWNRITGPYWWTYCAADPLQRPHAADALVQARADQRAGAVRHLDHRQRRHVARAVRDRRHEPAPRLPALVVGPLQRRRSGTWRTYFGTIGLFLTLLLPVPPLPADDLDLRDADAAAGGAGRRRR